MSNYSFDEQQIICKVKTTLVTAGSSFRTDKKEVYSTAIKEEENEHARWVMQAILDNAEVAENNCSPLCDDSGIPHVVLEIGPDVAISGRFIDVIKEGIKQGLEDLPGRPMGICGDDIERIDQSGGLNPASSGVELAPVLIRRTEDNVIRLHILMLGGGPAIRAKTYRVFHKHSADVVINEIISWAKEATGQLGCTPCTLAVGIGRSHFEASSLMLQAMVDGNHNIQSDIEKRITAAVNESNVGPLGLHGKKTVLSTFIKVGPQRASGVRIVSMRPCCCFEPRIATVEL